MKLQAVKMEFPLNLKGYTSVSQFANQNKVTQGTVYRWIKRGKVASQQVNIMGQTRHFVQDLTGVKRDKRGRK